MKKLFRTMMAVAITAFVFAACEDVPEPYELPTPEPEEELTFTGKGTLESPYTVEDVVKYVQALDGNESDSAVFVKGVVKSIGEEFTTQYGNGTFVITDENGTKEFTAYRVKYLGNRKYTSSDTQIKVGDKVIVYGFVVNYRGNTPETVQNTGFLYELNGVNEGGINGGGTGTPAGTGTQADPYNVAAVLQYIATLGSDVTSDKEVYIKGKVKSIGEDFSTEYGNGTFTIEDEGVGNEFLCYRVKYLGNKKYQDGQTQVKVGDEVVVCAKVVNFRGNTPETAQNSGFLYELNGVSEGGGGSSGGGETGTPAGTGTQADPYNVAAVLQYIATLGSDVTSDKEYYIKGKVKSIGEDFSTEYGNGTFTIQDDGVDNEFLCYRVKYLGNEKYQAGQTKVKVGDEVVVCGKVVNFRGNTPETAQNTAYLYSLNGETGGNVTPTPQPTGEAKGSGTQTDPYNVAAILQYIATLGSDVTSDKEYYIKGKVKSIGEDFNTQYGNGTFTIEDEGVGNEFLCYRVKYLGNEKYQTGQTKVKVGDEVIVYGKVVNYRGNTPETAQNTAYLYSLNGSTEATQGGGGEEGGNEGGQGGQQTADGFVITMSDFGLANQADATTLTASDGTTLTFSKEGGKNAPKYYTAGGGSLRMYALNSLTITSSKTITKVVINTADPYQGTPYNGNDTMYGEAGSNKVTPTKDSDTQVTFTGFSSKTLKIVNDHSTNSGGTQLRIVKLTITYAE